MKRKSGWMTVGKASDVGLVRRYNEDSILALELSREAPGGATNIGLYAVADGLGGYEGGEVASRLALKALADVVTAALPPCIPCGAPVDARPRLRRVLAEGVQAANRQVYAESLTMDNHMATTLVAALVVGDSAWIANVGDSRAYLLRRKRLRQITRDHSLARLLVEAGEITPDEAHALPQRNIVTRCLGRAIRVAVDLFTVKLTPDVRLLLCSDGLWEMVRDEELSRVMRQAPNAHVVCERLVCLANHNGGVDNISVIVLGYEEAPDGSLLSQQQPDASQVSGA